MPWDVVLLVLLAFAAFFALGVTGAASAIVFNAGYLTLSTFGLTTHLPLHDALYWVAFANIAGSGLLWLALRATWRWESSLLPFIAGMIPLNALFTLLLPRLDPEALLLGLGPALIASGLVMARGRTPTFFSLSGSGYVSGVAGAFSGALSGLFGMGGPVAFLYLASRSVSPMVIRNRVLTIGFLASAERAIILLLSGSVTHEWVPTFALTLPAVGLGMLLGHAAHRHVPAHAFHLVLAALVTASGITALMSFIG